MLSTFSAFELVRAHKGKSKKIVGAPIRLPMIKIENEFICSEPIVKIKKKPVRTSFQSLRKKEKKVVKLNDLTDSVSKDLPQSLLKDFVVSPKLTNKIFAAIESSSLSESKSEFRRRSERRSNCLSSSKKSPFENIFRDLESSCEFTQEYRKQKNLSVASRPVSPWLYQGKSRHYSIFSGL